MSEASRLYTSDMLASAVELASWPPVETAALQGEARSRACGSTIAMDLDLTPDDRIETLGMRVRACVVGQAAAAIFARHARGKGLTDIQTAHAAMEAWLEGDAPTPDWPGIDLIAPARHYRGRHGAMLLPWKAALAALSSTHIDG